MIYHWIQTCDSDHLKCTQRRRQLQFPARFVYVGTSQSQSVVQLRESRTLPRDTRYVTLSHCWGEDFTFKLTSARYDEFAQGLSLNELPNTFRDAVVLTRWLGISYIWIDSMCIIQDSPSDWAQESLLMADIYHGSHLNVGANAAFGPASGLFQARNLLTVAPLKVNLTWKPQNLVRRPVLFFPEELGRRQLQDAPLSTRAWVTQERILAPRTVHFLSQKILWECRTRLFCESDPYGNIGSANDTLIGALAVPPAEDKPPSVRKAACLNKWNSVVSLYTRANLTYQTDKLVAIAGIAKHLKSMWGDSSVRYLAGLWSYELESSLLWSVFPAGTGRADPDAPSWSWASVQGHAHPFVSYPGLPMSLTAKIRDSSTTPLGDCFGRVTGGYILIEGPMCAVTLDCKSSGKRQVVLHGRQPREGVPKLWLRNLALRFDKLNFDVLPLASQESGPPDRLFLLGIGVERRVAGQPMHGLLLQRSGTQHGQFIRIGCWNLKDFSDPHFRGFFRGGPDFDETNCHSLILDEFQAMCLRPEEYEEEDRELRVYKIYIL